MNTKQKINLAISVLLTSFCFLHDQLYDTPVVPYSSAETIAEILFVGTLYTAIFYGILLCLYNGVLALYKKIRLANPDAA